VPRITNAELIVKLREVLANLDGLLSSASLPFTPVTEAALERWLQLAY
jgi:hypothetical protein